MDGIMLPHPLFPVVCRRYLLVHLGEKRDRVDGN